MGEDRSAPGKTAQAARSNIETVLRLEHEAQKRRTWSDRVSRGIVRFVGQPGFVLFHVLAIALWIGINAGAVPGVRPFDPFPYGVLTMIVSGEGVFLAILILMSQNVLDREADRRAHLELQISLLAERETTKSLKILHAIANRLEMEEARGDEEAAQLSQETDVETLAHDLERTLEERKRAD